MVNAPCWGMARQLNTQARLQLLHMRAYSCLHGALADFPIVVSIYVAAASSPV